MNDARTAPPAAVPPEVRQWIRQHRVAANGRVEPGTVYSVVLALAMAVALLGQPLLRVIWPAHPATDGTGQIDVAVAAGLVLLALFSLLRQCGPLVLGRSAATWLLPAPVSRQSLLTPALLLVATVALALGGLTGLATVGHLAPRPVPDLAPVIGAAGGAAAALALALAAVRGQHQAAYTRVVDRCVTAVGAVLLLLAVAARTSLASVVPMPVTWPGWASTPAIAVTAVGLLGLAFGGAVQAWRGLSRWPTHQIADASATAANYADAVYAVEPSFLADLRERGFWRRHAGLRPSHLIGAHKVPPLVAHDILTARRRARRIWWLAGTALAPVLVADRSPWLLIGVLLLGALGAASLTTHSVRTDTRNPALQRLLALSSRQVLRQRLVVPSLVAALWCTVALAALMLGGAISGIWWYALGVTVGPAVAVAAVQRARAGAHNIGSVLIDTPLGAFPTGLLLWLVNGVDVLALITLPLSITLVQTHPPEMVSWPPVLLQAATSALGAAVLLHRADR